MAKRRTYSNEWTYLGEKVSELPEKVEGFVYLIKELDTGRKYIGKKFTTRMAKVAGKTRRQKIESDWKFYYSSCDEIKDNAKIDPNNYERIVLQFCYSRGEVNFVETEMLFKLGALRDVKFINSQISAKWYQKNVMRYPPLTADIDFLSHSI